MGGARSPAHRGAGRARPARGCPAASSSSSPSPGLLAMRPEHLVLDEPTAQLDPAGTRLVADAIDAPGGRRRLDPGGRAEDRPAGRGLPRVRRARRRDAWRSTGRPPTSSATHGSPSSASPRPSAVRLRRAAGGRRRRPRHGCWRRWPMAELRVEGLVHVYARGRRPRARRRRPAPSRPASGWRWSARTAAARRRWCATSTACCGRPRGACWSTARDAATLTVAQLASRVGLVFQDPDRQIFAGSVRAEVEFGPRNLGRSGARPARGGRRRARRGRPGRRRGARTPTTSATRAESCSPWPRSSPCGRRCWSSTSRPPARTRAASSACAAIVEAVAGEGRTVIAISHDMRFVAETFGRVVVMRAGRVIARRDAGRGLRGRSLGRAALDVPRAAAGGGHRRPAGARLHADRREPDRCAAGAGRVAAPDPTAGRCSSRAAAGAGCHRRRIARLGGSSSRCSRPSIGPGIGRAMTECGHLVEPIGDAAQAEPAQGRRRSARRSPCCAGARTASDGWARLSSSMPRAPTPTAFTWFSPSWPSRMSSARFASLRVDWLKCGRTVDEHARPVQRLARRGRRDRGEPGAMDRILRAADGWQAAIADALAPRPPSDPARRAPLRTHP